MNLDSLNQQPTALDVYMRAELHALAQRVAVCGLVFVSSLALLYAGGVR